MVRGGKYDRVELNVSSDKWLGEYPIRGSQSEF